MRTEQDERRLAEIREFVSPADTVTDRVFLLQIIDQSRADLAAANERIARLEGVATAALRRARAALSVAIRAAVEDIDFDPQEHHAIKDIDAALAALSPAETG